MTSTPLTIRSFWDQRVAASGPAPFVTADGDSWTYEEFDRWANRLANGLAEAGVRVGTTVALLLPNSIELLRIELAIQKLGAVMLPMIAGSTLAEIEHVLTDSGARFLIIDPDAWRGLTERQDLVDALERAYVIGGQGELAYNVLISPDENSPAPPAVRPMDPAALMYTSGSTSKPKGVVQPQSGFASAGFAIAKRMGATAEDHWLCAGPLFHTGATHMVVAPAIAAGSQMTLLNRFGPATFWRIARQSGATLAGAFPSMLSLLEANPPSPADRDHKLRALFCHVRSDAFVERFGVDICTVWAMTETSGMGTLTEPGYDRYEPQLIGWPFPEDAEVKIVDERGETLPTGTQGELCFRHPQTMLRYHEDPENTARTLVDGWVHSGDLCRLDDEGRVYFHGRLKNVVKRSGENIAGEEVEFAVQEHPGVEDCIVTGVPDPIRTEEVHITVAVRAPDDPSEHEIVRWAAERLSRWKVPRYVQITHEPLPRLANGKIDRAWVTHAVNVKSSWDSANDRESING